MEVNLQQKSLNDQIGMSKFKARQAAQERDLAKNDLERIIQSVKNKTNRLYNHEKPLSNLKTNIPPRGLRSERDYGKTGSSHSRRNLDTYQKLYFNDFSNPGSKQLAHYDNDPFNINVGAPAQPRIHYGNNKDNYQSTYGAILNTNSQAVSLETPGDSQQNFNQPKHDPLSYGNRQFEVESNHAINQISNLLSFYNNLDDMISPADSYPTYEPVNKSLKNMQPLNMGGMEMVTTSQPLEIDEPHKDDHKADIEQLDNVLESLANA